jgi:hypothetical protein
MSTLMYNEVENFLFEDFKKHQYLSDQNREMSEQDIDMVSGGYYLSGYDGAGAIMATVGFGSLFTPIGPITAGIALGSTAGLAAAQFWADNF